MEWDLAGKPKILVETCFSASRSASYMTFSSLPSSLSKIIVRNHPVIYYSSVSVLLLWLYSSLLGPWPLFFSFLILYTVGKTPWTGDQPVARPLLTEQHKHRINAHNTDIHTLSGIRTHDPSVRASEDSSCLRPRGRCDRRVSVYA
jgi:hypothetical protein